MTWTANFWSSDAIGAAHSDASSAALASNRLGCVPTGAVVPAGRSDVWGRVGLPERVRTFIRVLFGAAFWILAINNIALGLTAAAAETRVSAYVVRLLAFLLIIAAIVQKNRVRP